MKKLAPAVFSFFGFLIGLFYLQSTMVNAYAETEQQSTIIRPFIFQAVLTDGTTAGDLILGQTTVEQAVKMFPKTPPSYEGNPRLPHGYPPVKVGKIKPKPTLVFNPSMTMYALFFDENKKLVIINELLAQKKSQQEIIGQYPQLKETYRDSLEYEMQGEIKPCVTFMVLFSSEDSVATQAAYAFTCETK